MFEKQFLKNIDDDKEYLQKQRKVQEIVRRIFMRISIKSYYIYICFLWNDEKYDDILQELFRTCCN